MKTRKTVLAVIAAIALALPAFGEAIDLVVMVDTSESMFPYFDDMVRYLLRDILEQRLHPGDTFHLLSFSGAPESEIAAEIGDKASAQRAYDRILLLQPFGRYTDLVAALQFLFRYVQELPERNRKEILLLTDGVHDPPPESPNRVPREEVRKELARLSKEIRQEGWNVHILNFPAGSDAAGYLPEIGRAMGVPVVPYRDNGQGTLTGATTGFPSLVFPGDLGKVGQRFSVPFLVRNYQQSPILVRMTGMECDGAPILDRPADVTIPANAEGTLTVDCRLPDSFPTGENRRSVKLLFDGDLRISPTEGILSFTYKGDGRISFDRTTLLTVLYILAALAAAALLVRFFLFMRHKLHETSFESFFRTASREAFHDAPSPDSPRTAAASGPYGRRPAKVSLMGGAARQGEAHDAAARAAARAAAPNAPESGAGAASGPHRSGHRATVPLMEVGYPQPRRRTGSSGAPTGRPIEMRVADQNQRIGLRNVHRIAPGTSRSVGGGMSAFLVFLYAVPSGIAEVRNEGSRYVFRALRPEYFPGLSGSVADCLDREIQAVTPRGKRMSLHFSEYVSPTDQINALMLSIRLKIPAVPIGG